MRKTIAAVVVALALFAVVARFERAAAVVPQKPPAREAPLHQGGYLNSYVALLKSDLKARKRGFITEGLRLNAKEAEVFWPLYKSYESDMKRHDDARFQLIKDYADSSDRMTDARAKELIERRLALQGQRVELEKTYFKRFAKALPGKTVARFFQLEYRFNLLLDVKTVSEVPLVE